MNATAATLTDRYVWTVARSVPEAQRAELDRELRERIIDAVDARLATDPGPSIDAAERAVLTELGDPAAVAASYLDLPLQLIGPRYFLVWWRLLKLLWTTVVPIAAAGLLLAQLIAGTGIWATIGTLAVVTLHLGVHLGFWTTLVFAIIDRSAQQAPELEWTPDMLPTSFEDTSTSRASEFVASVVVLVLFAAALVGQQLGVPWVPPLESVPLLDPALGSFWLPYALTLVGFEIGFALLVFRRGWTWSLAALNTVLNVAFAAPALWLLTTGRLVNPGVLEALRLSSGELAPVLVALTVTLVVVASTRDVVNGFRRARRAWSGGSRPPAGASEPSRVV